MKTLKSPFSLFLIVFVFILITCKEREITNPFDSACPKEIFTPSDFKAEQKGAAVQLTWKQANTLIIGFVINRNENDDAMTELSKEEFAKWRSQIAASYTGMACYCKTLSQLKETLVAQ